MRGWTPLFVWLLLVGMSIGPVAAFHEPAPPGRDDPAMKDLGETVEVTVEAGEGTTWYGYEVPDDHYVRLVAEVEVKGELILHTEAVDARAMSSLVLRGCCEDPDAETFTFTHDYRMFGADTFILAWQIEEGTTNNITFTVDAHPMPDVAVTALWVERDTLAGTDTLSRTIHAVVSNAGPGDAEDVTVWLAVEGETQGEYDLGRFDNVSIRAGHSIQFITGWTAWHAVGDITFEAIIGVSEPDKSWSDNEAYLEDHVLVDGTGYGFVW